MASNFEKLREELKKEAAELQKEQAINRKFHNFQARYNKLFETVMFRMLKTNSDTEFYANFLINANRINSYAIASPFSHQVTNTRINLLMNPLLVINYGMEDIAVLLKHEVIHMICEHHKSVTENALKYPKVIPLLASDLIANYILVKEGNTLNDKMWTPTKIKKLFNEDIIINKNSTVSNVSAILNSWRDTNEAFDEWVNLNSASNKNEMMEALSKLLDAMQAGGICGEGDAVFTEDDINNILGSLLIDQESDNLLISDMLKQITIDAVSNSRGLFPAGLEGYIKAMMAPPVITWQEELARFLGSIAAGQKPTVFRRNRRLPERIDLKGNLRDKEVDVVVAIDTSGSMSDSIIAECMNEIFAITKLMKTEISIVECDSVVQRYYKANCPEDVKPDIKGRGGTSFTPVFDWMVENKKKDSVLIYMTDGYGENHIEAKNIHQGTIWLIKGNKENLSLKGQNLPLRSKVLSLDNK